MSAPALLAAGCMSRSSNETSLDAGERLGDGSTSPSSDAREPSTCGNRPDERWQVLRLEDEWTEVPLARNAAIIEIIAPMPLVLFPFTDDMTALSVEDPAVLDKLQRFDLRPIRFPLNYGPEVPLAARLGIWTRFPGAEIKLRVLENCSSVRGWVDLEPTAASTLRGTATGHWSVQKITDVGWRIVNPAGLALFRFGVSGAQDQEYTDRSGSTPYLDSLAQRGIEKTDQWRSVLRDMGANMWGSWRDLDADNEIPMPNIRDPFFVGSEMRYLTTDGSRPVPDVRDSRTRQEILRIIDLEVVPYVFDPSVIGFRLGNEPAWTPDLVYSGRLAEATLFLANAIRDAIDRASGGTIKKLVFGWGEADTHIPEGCFSEQAGLVDCLLVNSYDYLPTLFSEAFERDGVDKACMILESNILVNGDRFAGFDIATYANQTLAGRGLARYLAYAAHPDTAFVGSCMFPLVSSPPGGRESDGEQMDGVIDTDGSIREYKVVAAGSAMQTLNRGTTDVIW